MSQGIENPFVPPVPPLPSLYTPSGQVNSIPRQPPSVPRRVPSVPRVPTSYSFDDIYGGYSAPSRPGTTHTTHRRASEIMTPSTSSLLPWRSNDTPAPPVPPINHHAFTTNGYQGTSQHRQPRIPTPKAGGKRRSPPAPQEEIRGPIVPMAQTPGMGLSEHGWTGVIPNFR
ncbi:hypothetical protein BCR39DRAFT_513956 [Naematelia encephala]|uniref:Uncharacterized protein n=1 Tax=Naematelia encephala TaxID=71784 RepID=A0A1Y2BIR2_9TREE|nr:hypothetical protein BCR39DRAFT_513956 [Naematelia encephala]